MSNKQNDRYNESKREALAEIPAKTFSILTTADKLNLAIEQVAVFIKTDNFLNKIKWT